MEQADSSGFSLSSTVIKGHEPQCLALEPFQHSSVCYLNRGTTDAAAAFESGQEKPKVLFVLIHFPHLTHPHRSEPTP